MYEGGFTFEEYNEQIPDHKEVLSLLNDDQDIKDFFHSIDSYILNIQQNEDKYATDHVCVAKIGETTIGMTMSKQYPDYVEVYYALLPKFQLEGIGAFMLESFCTCLFRTYGLDKLYLQINSKNDKHRIIASRVGFTKDKQSRYVINNYVQNH